MMTYTRMRTIDLVLADICSNPVGTLVEDAVRSIAARIGRSAGGITPALKRLAADGWITYLSDGRGTLIEVLKTDHELDRSIEAQAPIEEAPIAPICPDVPIVNDQAPDRSESDQLPDRSACMEDHESRTQEEEIARPLFDRLVAQPGMSRSLALRIARHPIGSLTDFLFDLKVAQTIPDLRSPFYFTIARWRDGQRVVALQEADHGQHAKPHSRSYPQSRRRAERPGTSRGVAGSGAVDPAVYAAILAEAVPLDIDIDSDV